MYDMHDIHLPNICELSVSRVNVMVIGERSGRCASEAARERHVF